MSWKPVSLARTQSFGHKSTGRYGLHENECRFTDGVKAHEPGKCSSLSCKLGTVSMDDYHDYDACGSHHGSVSCKNRSFSGTKCGHETRNADEDSFHEHSKYSSSVHLAHRCHESPSSLRCIESHSLPNPVKEDKIEEDADSSPLFDRRRSLDDGIFAKLESSLSIEDICHQLVSIAYV